MQVFSEPLASFLPLQLLSRMHGRAGERPTAVHFPAAVLFVDVSRYTSLIERFARRGQEGLERVPDLLARSHTRCVDKVYESGGEVVQMAGDALIACWPADVDHVGSAVDAAVQCANWICRDRDDDSTIASGINPAVHVGVGAGSVWAAAVGGQPLWCLLAAGDAVAQAARAQSEAGAWEYVLSSEARFEFARRRSAEKSYQPGGMATVPGAEWLAGFLPPELRGGEMHGDMVESLAEIRPVTALFARIGGLEYGPHALVHHQALCAALQQHLHRNDGPAGQLLYDDKGLVFVGVFGALGSFHRDDPLHAIDSTRGIIATTRSMGLSAAIGVATGEALFRVVGSGRRRQLMVLGAPMNRAARLMAAINEGALCDAPTERASRNRYCFEERGTLQLEGLGDASAVFAPLQPRAAVAARRTLIGRERELAVLQRGFEDARRGLRRLVIVSGEPGIGKTAIVESFIEKIGSLSVAVARPERMDRHTFLRPWRRVLTSVLSLDGNAEIGEVMRAIASRLHGNASIVERLPLLDGMFGMAVAQTEATRHLDGAHRADATMRLVGDLLGALAPRPLAIVFEDSQWLDSTSWRLIEWVLTSLASLHVVLCLRPEESPSEVDSLRRRFADICRVSNLEELGDEEISELVNRTLGGTPAHEALARRISQLAGGNPFFAEEIALTLRSEGLIAVREGSWRAIQSLDGLRYFGGVERVIRERVDRLDPPTQSVLKAAAVIGRSFTRPELIAVLTELRPAALDDALAALVAADLVRTVDSKPGHYVFRHDQTRDVIYRSIPGDVRRRLHNAVARWMETGQSPALEPDISLLVQHFQAAGDRDKTVHYSDVAAFRALQSGAFREVEAFLEICLSHEAREPWTAAQRLQAVRWRRQLGEAYYGLGDIQTQSSTVRRALMLAGQPVPGSTTALARRLLSKAGRLAVQYLSRLPSQAAIDDPASSWERELARCLSQAAVVDYFELRITRAFCQAVAAVVHAERAGLCIEFVLASAQLACAFGILGQRRMSRRFMNRAEESAVAMNDPAAHAQVCYLDSLWRIGYGEWAVVDRRLDQAQQLALAAGDQLAWCNAQAIRYWALYYQGDQAALERTAQALLSHAQNSGNVQQEIWALRCKSLCLLHSDRPREAVDILRLSTSALPGSADLAERVSSKGVFALALARVGLHRDSVEAASDTLHLLRDMRRPTVHSTLPGISGVAEVLFRGREAGLAREYDQWSRWERQVLQQLNRYRRVFPLGEPQYLFWYGVSRWLDDHPDAALTAWRRALLVARRLSLRRDESMILAELRRCELKP